jgi:hypothetical protein
MVFSSDTILNLFFFFQKIKRIGNKKFKHLIYIQTTCNIAIAPTLLQVFTIVAFNSVLLLFCSIHGLYSFTDI